MGVPGGVGVLLVLEVYRRVTELEVADLRGRGSLWHQGDCTKVRTARKERGEFEREAAKRAHTKIGWLRLVIWST